MKYYRLLSILICCLLPVTVFGQTVRFIASDGQPLAADFVVPDQPADLHIGVILLPMYRHTKESWAPLVRQMSAAGLTSLALDLRGHGQSRYGADGSDGEVQVIGRDPRFFNSMYLDVVAADAWLRAKGPKLRKIMLVGASVGCSVAVQAVTQGGVQAAAVVLMTPGKNYLGIPTMAHVEKWPGTPLLILSSEEEQQRGAAALFKLLQARGAELQLYSQANIHGTNMFGKVDGVEQFIVNWLIAKK